LLGARPLSSKLRFDCRAVGRKLYELTRHNVAPIAEEGLKQIAALYRIKGQVQGQSQQTALSVNASFTCRQ